MCIEKKYFIDISEDSLIFLYFPCVKYFIDIGVDGIQKTRLIVYLFRHNAVCETFRHN